MTIAVETIGDDDVASWDHFVNAHDASTIYHRAGWKRIIESVFGRDTYYLAARKEGDIAGVLPLVHLRSPFFGSYLVSTPYVNYGGVLAADERVAEALFNEAVSIGEALNVDHLELRHTKKSFDLPTRTDKISMVLDFPESQDALLKQLGAKRRSQIRRPAKEGATCISGGIELLDDFYFVLCRKYRALGVPVYSKAWFRAILETFSNSARIFVAHLDSQPAAASLVVETRKSVMEVPWAGSLRFADRYGINMYLYWQMIEHAMVDGFTAFDFGRCTEGSGTHRFKKQWGAEPVQLYWEYWLPNSDELPMLSSSNPRYQTAVRLWQKMPLWMTNTLGPAIVKNLP